MPSELASNQSQTVVQVFVIGGIVVKLPKPALVLFEAPQGQRPWVEWESARRLGIASEIDRVGSVTLRAVG